jgi:hypothetical protein
VFTLFDKSPVGIDAPPERPSENGFVALVTLCAPATVALEITIAATAANFERLTMNCSPERF